MFSKWPPFLMELCRDAGVTEGGLLSLYFIYIFLEYSIGNGCFKKKQKKGGYCCSHLCRNLYLLSTKSNFNVTPVAVSANGKQWEKVNFYFDKWNLFITIIDFHVFVENCRGSLHTYPLMYQTYINKIIFEFEFKSCRVFVRKINTFGNFSFTTKTLCTCSYNPHHNRELIRKP